VTGADVTGAEVTGAEVTGADVTGADVTGAEIGAEVVRTGTGFTARGAFPGFGLVALGDFLRGAGLGFFTTGAGRRKILSSAREPSAYQNIILELELLKS
jgi:hypothetical protein